MPLGPETSRIRRLDLIVIPAVLQSAVMRSLHDDLLAGHLGIAKTLAQICQRYFWDGMIRDIYDWCKSCVSCAQCKDPRPGTKAPLHPIPCGQPFDMWGIDIMGKLPQTVDGNQYILVATEYVTKYVVVCPMFDQTAETVARAIVENVLLKFSMPRTILTD
ncbi:MAG: transposase family protein [bacterium]|nr:transposase family protein [bacterium]